MKLLLRYQLREILVPLVVWVGFLFLILFVMSFLRGTDVLLGSAVTAKDLALFVLYLSPQFLQQAVPIAFLLAILLGLGRLSEDGELTALRAVGVGPWQLLGGPLVMGVVLGLLMLGLNVSITPWGLRSVRAAVNEVIKKNLAGDVKAGVFYEDLANLTVYSEQVDATQRRWRNVLVHDDRDPASPLLVLAKEGRVRAVGSSEELTLELSEGQLHRADRGGPEYSSIEFDRAEVVVGMEGSFFSKNRFRSPKEELTPSQLVEAARTAEGAGQSGRPYLMTLHWRLGQALTPVAFALMGAPLAMGRRHGGRARGYLLTIGGYVLYYVLARVCVALGERGRLDLLVSGQLPNLVFAGLGLLALARLSRASA